MSIKRSFFLLLPVFVTGCSYNPFGEKEPAPVYQERPVIVQAPEPVPAPAPAPVQTIEINKMPDMPAPAVTPLEPEPLTPEQTRQMLTPEQEQALNALEKPTSLDPSSTSLLPSPSAVAQPPQPAPLTMAMNAVPAPPPVPAEPVLPVPSMEPGTIVPQPAAAVPPSVAAPDVVAMVTPPAPPPPPPVFEPLQTFAPLSAVTQTLVLAADKSVARGNIDSASATIERAMRIEPKNPTLLYKLALLRLKQSKPVLAEDLAKKSALMATNDKPLKKHSWLLIARAREMQNDMDGAEKARKQAEKF
ncbi:hypothetical protein KFZ76_03335 [Methylovulum psychrotolerans]|jgi:hypothetical protein|uniref:hypothetical protein n=1 Tax=Methylovulum psychrotolerans TaxID=1704499 RepID=UPI001BFFB5CB|nr:hypothetical protein [Methylovulum psychrotolerans]MBT9096746.1 hypothetical protein [Methylovulum psychrotolerans]